MSKLAYRAALPTPQLPIRIIDSLPWAGRTPDISNLQTFRTEYYRPESRTSTPVLLSGACADWPGLRRWIDPEYLLRTAGSSLLQVEHGETYFDNAIERLSMQNLLKHFSKVAPGEVSSLYLAATPLNEVNRAFWRDVWVPPWISQLGGRLFSTNMWLGKGNRSGLHYDGMDGLLVVVCGAKIAYMCPPTDTKFLYPRSVLGQQHASVIPTALTFDYLTSRTLPPSHEGSLQVLNQYPLLDHAEFSSALLQPGDALFIPKGWWHCVKCAEDEVRGTEPSLYTAAVNFWW
jgi:hypothetical protein